jgi:hypothetical protein
MITAANVTSRAVVVVLFGPIVLDWAVVRVLNLRLTLISMNRLITNYETADSSNG